jgi:hypothetical protein
MFSLPQAPKGENQQVREGDTDENPISLVGCTKSEFESLLELMNPRCATLSNRGEDISHSSNRDGPGVPHLIKEQWMGVLKLGRLWDMPKVCYILNRS